MRAPAGLVPLWLLLAASASGAGDPAAPFYCFQCTGESTDPEDHCTDSGWVSIPRGRRLAYKFLCPDNMDSFCMKTTQVWQSGKRGVPDRYRTQRACSGSTRLSKHTGSAGEAGATRFKVSVGCTDFSRNPDTGELLQMCFCDGSLCNGAGRLAGGWALALATAVTLALRW